MSILIRLSYASDNLIENRHARHDLLKAINEISISDRHPAPVYGVLYDSEKGIIHCIEGQKEHVDQLYRHLMNKTQRQHITLLSYEQIDAISMNQLATAQLTTNPALQQSNSLSLALLHRLDKTFEEIRQLPAEPFSPSLRCINSLYLFAALFLALLISYGLSLLNIFMNLFSSLKKRRLDTVKSVNDIINHTKRQV